jgi:hypothetical protein
VRHVDFIVGYFVVGYMYEEASKKKAANSLDAENCILTSVRTMHVRVGSRRYTSYL